jgi:hypothetical protein
MRLRFQTSLALLLILAAVPLSGCGRERASPFSRDPAAPVSVIPDGFGVNIHFTDPQPGEMKMIAESGVRWVRMDFKWDLTESAKGTYDFAPYDRLMSALAPFGLRALFILDYGNPLYDDGGPPRTEAAREAFARWAVAAARHFAGRGIVWETWNEPNNQTFWRPRPNVNEYAALALVVARAFRAAVPDEKLVGPAVSEMDFAFLEGCFKAGLLEYWPAVSVHPYLRSNPELVSGDYSHLREMIKTSAPKGKEIEIFSGEWGYSAEWRGMNEERQSQFLARQWLTNVANDIPLSIWYDWRDDGSEPNEPEHHFGMVSIAYHEGREPVYDPKPAYLAAKTLTTFFGGYQYEKRLNVGAPDDYVLFFRKGTNLRVAAWTTSNREHPLVVPLDAGQYTTVTHTGGKAASITASQSGVPITLSAAPVYLRR